MSTAAQPLPTHLELLERLAGSGLLEDCQAPLWLPEAANPRSAKSAVAQLSGRMTIGGHVFHLRVNLPHALSLYLPEVQLVDMSPRIDLPHLIGENRLCFEAGANLLDPDDPWAVLRESLLFVRGMLSDILEGDRAKEFIQEAVAYWKTLARGRIIDCIVEASDRPHRTFAIFRDGEMCAVSDGLDLYVQSLSGRSAEGLTQKSAIYLPINPTAGDLEFRPGDLSELGGLRKCIRALSEEDRSVLSLLLTHCEEQREALVLGVRRSEGERALLGVLLSDIQGGHPLAEDSAQAKVIPIDLVRRDYSFLAPRGGAGPDLRECRVLIAGCGAVGGYLALALARAGVGGLSLVDADVFELENTYRHACGMARRGLSKVEGLAREIERTVPYVEVMRYPMRVEDLLRESPDVLREHELVISALGHPTIELELNRHIWLYPEHAPALFSWVEPLGLGGHALLTHSEGPDGPSRGCLQCLYRRPIEGGGIENRSAFARSGVTYTRDMLGCGSRFLPFADLDAQRTAEVAARLALRVLRREVTESPLLSWKGSREAFDAAGYSVTKRYELEQAQLDAFRLSYIREDCPVCSAG